MRYRFLFVLLTLSLSACSFNAELVTPPPLPLPTLSSTSTPNIILATVISTPMSVMELPTETPPPFPTFTPTATVQSSPINLGVAPITFDVNGTYRDVVDTMSAGTSKTYSVSALKGQIMSVSIHQGPDENWATIPMKITGADGTTFCPTQPNQECYFWRGVLPSTQDYFVTLTPLVNVSNFIMRVAINPPGVATQFFAYVSQDGHFAFQYPDRFAPARLYGAPMSKFQPELALQLIESAHYINTNLVEAYFLYGSSKDPKIISTCTQPLVADGPENIVGHVNLSGVDFVYSEAYGVATGNLYETVYYRTVYKDTCYEISFMMHSGNIGNYPADSGIKEFDHDAVKQELHDIISKLVIN